MGLGEWRKSRYFLSLSKHHIMVPKVTMCRWLNIYLLTRIPIPSRHVTPTRDTSHPTTNVPFRFPQRLFAKTPTRHHWVTIIHQKSILCVCVCEWYNVNCFLPFFATHAFRNWKWCFHSLRSVIVIVKMYMCYNFFFISTLGDEAHD